VASLSERYAGAAFDYLGDAKKAEQVANELQAFAELIDSNQELSAVCHSAVFSSDRRIEVVVEVAQKMGLSEPTQRFLKVVAENGRLTFLKKIGEGLRRRMLESANRAPLQVDAPIELDTSEKEAIAKKFQKTLGKEVEATFHVDPKLLGGIRVTVAGRTYDATLANQLGALKEKMAGG